MTVREIVDSAKKGKGDLSKIMKEREEEAASEYREAKLRRLIAEEKAKVQQIEKSGGKLEPGLAKGFTSHVFELAEVDPNKAKEFLNSLDKESMDKLAYLMALENDRAGAFLKLAQSTGTSTKDMIEIMKFMRGNGGMDLKGIASIFEAGVNAAKANNPQPASMQQGVDHIMKTYVNPFVETLKTKDKELWEERFRNMESKIVNPVEWFKSQKAIAGELGFREAGKTSEVDIKLEEMRQSHDLDMVKLNWEQRKFLIQQEAERDKWAAIQSTFAPAFAMAAPEIRNQLKKVGKEVGKSLGGNPEEAPQAPEGNLATFTCPSCEAQFTVRIPPNAPEEVPIKCLKCGTVTNAKLSQTPPSEGTSGKTTETPRGRLGAKYSFDSSRTPERAK